MKQEALQEHKYPPCLIWGMWNSLDIHETVYLKMFQSVPCWTNSENFIKICSFSHNVANRQTEMKTLPSLFLRLRYQKSENFLPRFVQYCIDVASEWASRVHGTVLLWQVYMRLRVHGMIQCCCVRQLRRKVDGTMQCCCGRWMKFRFHGTIRCCCVKWMRLRVHGTTQCCWGRCMRLRFSIFP